MSSNIYADIGARDPVGMLVKASLMVEIGETIRRKKLSRTKAAEIMGIPRSKLLELLRGRFRDISTAPMMSYLTRLGPWIGIVVNSSS
jgi:predicted XRE-type DNA-binding protein